MIEEAIRSFAWALDFAFALGMARRDLSCFAVCCVLRGNKRSASPERLKKKRKVVLVKAQAAAEAEQVRAKPEPIRGGTAGRVLRGLLGARPEPGEAEKPLVEMKKATELRTAKPSPQPRAMR